MSVTRTVQFDFCRRRPGRGTVLLEVLLSLAILTLGMATIGIQINGGFKLEIEAAELFRRSSLIESMVSQVETLVARELAESQTEGTASGPARDLEIEGEFGLVFPGYGYRVLIEPTEVLDLNRVSIELLEAPYNPDTGDLLEEGERVHLVRMLRASPPKINLEKLGVNLPPEQRTLLETGGLLDESGNLNIQALLGMEPGALLELLPLLISAFGGGQMAEMMGNMSPDQLLELLQEKQRINSDPQGQGQGTSDPGSGAGNQGDQPGTKPPAELFDETEPGGGLTQDQYEWMLQQLQNKGGRR